MASGAEATSVNISDLRFNPVLHKGYKVIQELGPDLLMMQEKTKGSDGPHCFCLSNLVGSNAGALGRALK